MCRQQNSKFYAKCEQGFTASETLNLVCYHKFLSLQVVRRESVFILSSDVKQLVKQPIKVNVKNGYFDGVRRGTTPILPNKGTVNLSHNVKL